MKQVKSGVAQTEILYPHRAAEPEFKSSSFTLVALSTCAEGHRVNLLIPATASCGQ